MVMSSNNKIEKGLEELRLSLMMGIEPVDPPDSLRDKIMSIAKKKPKRFSFLAYWPKAAVVACILLLGLWGFSLYQIEQLKDRPTAQYTNPLGELGTALGNVQKELPLISKQADLNGKAYVLHGQDGSKLVITSEGLKKSKETNVLQVWVNDNGVTKSVGAVEPMGGKAMFSCAIKNAEAVFITEEDGYKLEPEGKVLLFSEGNANPNLVANKDENPKEMQQNDNNDFEPDYRPVTHQPIEQDSDKKQSAGKETGNDDSNKGGNDNEGSQEPPKPDNPGKPEDDDGGPDNNNDEGKGGQEEKGIKDYLITANVELGKLVDLKVELIGKHGLIRIESQALHEKMDGVNTP